jgi:hypothetical protein
MDRMCSTHEGDEKFVPKNWSENMKGRDHSEDVGVDGRVILERISKIGWECINCIHLAQDRDQWRALVNVVIKLRVERKSGKFID